MNIDITPLMYAGWVSPDIATECPLNEEGYSETVVFRLHIKFENETRDVFIFKSDFVSENADRIFPREGGFLNTFTYDGDDSEIAWALVKQILDEHYEDCPLGIDNWFLSADIQMCFDGEEWGWDS